MPTSPSGEVKKLGVQRCCGGRISLVQGNASGLLGTRRFCSARTRSPNDAFETSRFLISLASPRLASRWSFSFPDFCGLKKALWSMASQGVVERTISRSNCFLKNHLWMLVVTVLPVLHCVLCTESKPRQKKRTPGVCCQARNSSKRI